MRLDTEVLSAGVDDEHLRRAKRKLCSGLAKNDLLAVLCALHEYRAYKFCFNKDVNFQTHIFTPEHPRKTSKKTKNYTKNDLKRDIQVVLMSFAPKCLTR